MQADSPGFYLCLFVILLDTHNSVAIETLVGNPPLASTSDIGAPGKIFVHDQPFTSRGGVVAVISYFQNQNPAIFQIWRPDGTITANNLPMRLIHQFTIVPKEVKQEALVNLNTLNIRCVETQVGDRFALFIADGNTPSSNVFTYNFDTPETLIYTYPDTKHVPVVGEKITFDTLRLPLSFSVQAVAFIGEPAANGSLVAPTCEEIEQYTVVIVPTTEPNTDSPDITMSPLIPGPPGPVGPPGLNGSIGAPGPPGTQGMPGATGPAGPEGPKGDKGDLGNQGEDGTPGAKGEKGAQGPQGVKGDVGLKGAMGPSGADGIPGATGVTGPAGVPGVIGPPGLTGSPGTAGSPGVGTKGDKGDRGLPGPPGSGGATSGVSNTNNTVPVTPKSGASTGGESSSSSALSALMEPEIILLLLIWDVILTLVMVTMCVMAVFRRSSASKNKISNAGNSGHSNTGGELHTSSRVNSGGISVKRRNGKYNDSGPSSSSEA